MFPKPFDWEEDHQDALIDCLETLSEEEAVYRGFRLADIARATQRIRASRHLESRRPYTAPPAPLPQPDERLA